MKLKKNIFPKKLEPYKGIIYFIIILLASNFFWKLTVKGEESDTLVTFLGMDISAPFNYMSFHFASATANILHFFGLDVNQKGTLLVFPNNHGVHIVWGCTGIKQAYIFFCIIAFTRGPWKKKLWYIPAGIFIVYLFNLLRMTAITASVQNHLEWFDFLHEVFFKYLFYGVIFLMWVLWDERIAMKKKKKQSTNEEPSINNNPQVNP